MKEPSSEHGEADLTFGSQDLVVSFGATAFRPGRSRPDSPLTIRVVPIELAEANRLVDLWHRHHKPAVGHRFSLGVVDSSGEWHGAAIVGRPVARLAGSPREVLEVVRLVTDGTQNACSMLYSAAARAGKALGYLRIQTYILEEETGTSLKASGWECEGRAGGGQWKHTDGKPRRTDQPTTVKTRWAKILNIGGSVSDLPSAPESPEMTLFNASEVLR